MIKNKRMLKIVFLFCVLFTTYTINAKALNIGDTYKFIVDEITWKTQPNGENYTKELHYEQSLEILYSNAEIIKIAEISSGYQIGVLNYTEAHKYYKAIIGSIFIQSSRFNEYYGLWESNENLYEIYVGSYIGENFTKEIRTAENYTFKGTFQKYNENVSVDMEYNETTGEIINIFDNFNIAAEIYVKYDPDGVLIELKSEVKAIGQKYMYGNEMIRKRVEEFPKTEQSAISHEIIISAIGISAITLVLKKLKRIKEKTNFEQYN
ncbi:MAG: hypothetical protein ACTSYN_03480 [Candidatus Heimdallarchaeaceae archaeon]